MGKSVGHRHRWRRPACVAASCGGRRGNDAEASTTVPDDGHERATTTRPRKHTTTTEAPRPRRVTIRPLFVRGDEGGVGKEVVSIDALDRRHPPARLLRGRARRPGRPEPGRRRGTRSPWPRCSPGAPLEGRYQLRDQRPDRRAERRRARRPSPCCRSCGATTLAEDITMTGTINPDGTIGPVGGIPEKVLGRGRRGHQARCSSRSVSATRRRSRPASSSTWSPWVSARVSRSSRSTTSTTPTRDLTGEELRAPAGRRPTPRLDDKVYDRLAGPDERRAGQLPAVGRGVQLARPEIQEVLGELAAEAQALGRAGRQTSSARASRPAPSRRPPRPRHRQRRGEGGRGAAGVLPPGHRSLLPAGRRQPGHRGRGVRAAGPAEDLRADARSATPPRLMNTYSIAFDALGRGPASPRASSTASLEDARGRRPHRSRRSSRRCCLPLVYYEFAGDAGRLRQGRPSRSGASSAGRPSSDDVDLAKVADFFRKASDTNFAAFQANVVKSYGEQYGRVGGRDARPASPTPTPTSPWPSRSATCSTA